MGSSQLLVSRNCLSPGGGMRHNIRGANEALRKRCRAPLAHKVYTGYSLSLYS